MDYKPLKVTDTVFNTNSNKKHVTRYNQAKQTVYRPTFSDLLKDLMMEQREQM